MENFKRDLQQLLMKYPQVKNVKFDITETVSLQDIAGQVVPPPSFIPLAPLIASETPAYVSPQKSALTVAEQTIAALSGRANIKIQQ